MTYILLRNNKETGPLSLDDLRETGLNPSDLVWVEGQSVCWLTPGEIQELKNLVGSPVTKTQVKEKSQMSADPSPALAVEKKGIYISMPVKEKVHPSSNDGLSAYQPHPEPEKDYSQSHSIKEKEDKAKPETHYSRPLDELKELYAKNLEQRSKKSSVNLQIPPQVKRALLYTGFIAIGIIAGILIRNSGSTKNATGSKNSTSQTSVTAASENKAPEAEENTWIPDQPIPASNATDQTVERPFTGKKEVPVETMGRSIKQESITKDRSREPIPAGISENTKTNEQSAAKDLPVREKKTIPADQMATLVAVKSNDYEVGSFGGIKNLEVTLTNTSGYSLDRVIVEVQYLKPRDEFLKAEKIQFDALGPNSSQTVAVPKSTRGVKVRLRVVRVESDQISGTTAGH